MNRQSSLVSVIIIFLNAEKFIEEAIESVFAQTYNNWELLLIDDGSTDASTNIAQYYAARNPRKVSYLEHANHQNQGMSTSRNLGIHNARGTYVAFLDADDLWLPRKLETQVSILDSQPDAGMLYGNTRYWYSWTGNPEHQGWDSIPDLGIPPDTLVEPPSLLPLYLCGKAAVPCTCSLLVRREVLKRLEGFEESFRGMYEDQAFYAKICLEESIYVSGKCLDWYRQHPESECNIAATTGVMVADRIRFLKWLVSYIEKRGVHNHDVWQALNEQLWLYRQPAWFPLPARMQWVVRWMKKWLLRSDEFMLSPLIRRKIWSK